MKHVFTITALFLTMIATGVKAQVNELRTATAEFEGVTHPVLQVLIEPDRKDAEKSIQNYLKKTHDVKLSGGKVMKAEEVVFGAVSGKKMDFYVRVKEADEGALMQFWGRFGYDIFIGQDNYPQEFAAMRMTIEDYLGEYLTDYYQDQIKDAEKDLSKVVKDKEKNTKEVEKLAASNEKAKEEIADLEAEIKENNEETSELKEEGQEMADQISQQKTALDRMRQKLQMVGSK